MRRSHHVRRSGLRQRHRNSGMTRPSGAKRRMPNDNRRRRCHCAAMCAARLAPAAGRLPSCYDWREAQSVCGVRTEEDGEMREARGRCQPEVGMGRRWRSGITASPSNARRSGPARRTPGRRAKRLPWSAAGPPRLPRPPRPRHSGGD